MRASPSTPYHGRVTTPSTEVSRAQAWGTLLILTAINFLNFIDRYVLSSVVDSVSSEFVLSDAQAGLLAVMFMVVYTVASPFIGFLSDRSIRKYFVAGAVALWSLATVGNAYVEDYESMLAMRALVGIGEAGYAAAAPAMISDVFSPKERGRKLAYFYLAIPMGSAIGFMLGGAISANATEWFGPALFEFLRLDAFPAPGWRLAFWIAGIPGLIFAIAAAVMREPVRGAMDTPESKAEAASQLGPKQAVKRLFASPAWRYATAGMTLLTFTMGALAFWGPTFLIRVHGYDEGAAGTVFGGITVVAGLVATLLGGFLGDRAYAKGAGGYLKVSGWGLVFAGPALALVPVFGAPMLVLALIFAAEFFMFLNTGPINAAVVGGVPSNVRASAMALNVLFIHTFGDAASPYLVGLLSDSTGPALVAAGIGENAAGAGLSLGIMLSAIPVFLGGVWLLRGAKYLDGLPDGMTAKDR